MLLLEHQGKALLRGKGIATPRGVVVVGAVELAEALPKLQGRVVLKAQVAAGGRGKSGGIAFAQTPEDAQIAFAELRALSIHGLAVESVLVEEQIDYVRERFIALIVQDGALQLLLGRKGGIHVEDTAETDPESVISLAIDPIDGPDASVVAASLGKLGIPAAYHAAYCETARALFDLAQASDARLVEINPLVELSDGRVLALDARVAIDEDALPRHPEFAAQVAQGAAAAAAQPAGREDLKFKRNPDVGGTIGLIGLGGGLNVTLMDWIGSLGGKVATLVDIDRAIGSGRAREGFHAALQAFDGDPSIRAILINVVTCGYRLDEIVAALLAALSARPRSGAKPIVLHLRGNSLSRTPLLLASSGYTNSPSIAHAVTAVVQAGSL
jgi:succinyl-CoA synthetase beta subunit